MDTEIRILFSSIDKEVVQLFYRWEIFRQLFDSGEENLNLLNQSGSNVFALLHGLIIENGLLTLCRLTDPEHSGGYPNLSIRYFLGKIEATLSKEVREDFHGKLAKLESATESLRIHRNKRIAHLDLNHAVKPERLPSVEFGAFEDALELVRSIMREFYLLIWNADTDYRQPSIACGCDGNHFLRVLRGAHDRRGANKE